MIGSRYVDSSPLEIGSILSVKHTGYHKHGTLRHAYFWRKRADVSENILQKNNPYFCKTTWRSKRIVVITVNHENNCEGFECKLG
jgi:hypothetical protein